MKTLIVAVASAALLSPSNAPSSLVGGANWWCVAALALGVGSILAGNAVAGLAAGILIDRAC